MSAPDAGGGTPKYTDEDLQNAFVEQTIIYLVGQPDAEIALTMLSHIIASVALNANNPEKVLLATIYQTTEILAQAFNMIEENPIEKAETIQ